MHILRSQSNVHGEDHSNSDGIELCKGLNYKQKETLLKSMLTDNDYCNENKDREVRINRYFSVAEEYLWCWCKMFHLVLDYYYDGLTRWSKKALDVWKRWEEIQFHQPTEDNEGTNDGGEDQINERPKERGKEKVVRK